jgi:Xaa-Pro aminopeptidase
MAFLSNSVFEFRLAAMRSLMARHGLDALAFTRPDYCFYASNIRPDVAPWERPFLTVVPAQGQPFMVLNELSVNSFRTAVDGRWAWITDCTFYSEHPRVTNRMWLTPQWPEMVAELLYGHGLHRAQIGVDAGGGPLALAGARLPDLRLVPLGERCRELRLVKHAEEIETMRRAALLSDWGMERMRENIRPGRGVGELDAAVAGLIMDEADRRFPGENLELRCHSVGGPGSACPHGDGRPTGYKLRPGDGMIVNIIPKLNGLVIENERTFFCGEPSGEQKRMYEVQRKAQAVARERYIAGEPLCAVDQAALALIEREGCADYVFHRTGHGIGIEGHEFPDDMAFNPRPLLENEVYSCEPALFVYGLGGFRIDDTMVVRKDKPLCLTEGTPRDLSWAIAG